MKARILLAAWLIGTGWAAVVNADQVNANQEPEAASPMPEEIRYPVVPHPVWVSAESLKTNLKSVGSLHPEAARSLEQMLQQQAEEGCIHKDIVWLDFVGQKVFESFEDALDRADFIVIGVVTGVANGIDAGGVPSTLVRLEKIQILHGDSKEDTFFFQVPLGDMSILGRHVCKTDHRFAGLPSIGDEVVLFSREPHEANPEYIDIQGPSEMVLLKKEGSALYPRRYYSALAEPSSVDPTPVNQASVDPGTTSSAENNLPASKDELYRALGLEGIR